LSELKQIERHERKLDDVQAKSDPTLDTPYRAQPSTSSMSV